MSNSNHATTPRAGMPDALLELLDRFGIAQGRPTATEILNGNRGRALPKWDRPWWNRH